MGPSVLSVLRESEYLRRSGNDGCVGALTYSVLKNLHSRAANEYVVRNDEQEVPPLACTSFSEPDLRDLLAVADEDGTVHLLRTGRPTEGMTVATAWQAHENAIFDVCARPGRCHLATASGDLSVGLFDVVQLTSVASFRAHRGSVKCVRFLQGHSDVFASGARDGGVVVWDARSSKPQMTIPKAHSMSPGGHHGTPNRKRSHGGHVTSATSSVTACVFRDEHHLVTCGASSGVVKVWDLRKNYQLYKNDPRALACLPYPGHSTAVHGYTGLVLDSSGRHLFASCTDSRIYRFDLHLDGGHPPKPLGVYRGHSTHSFYVKLALTSDGRFLASGSSDAATYIWQVDEPGWPKLKLSGHRAEVTALAWDSWHPARLTTCGDDNRVLLWDAAGAVEENKNETQVSAHAEMFVAVAEIPEEKTPGRRSDAVTSAPTPSSSGGSAYHQVQTPTRPSSMADWLTPPTKRRLLDSEARSDQTNDFDRPASGPTEGASPLATSALLSPRKADNAVNVTQRRLLPRLEALAEGAAKIVGGGVGAGGCGFTTAVELLCCDTENLPMQNLETPPRPAVPEPSAAPSAVHGRKRHKIMTRLFRKQGTGADKGKKGSRAKRALLNTQPITSFFKC